MRSIVHYVNEVRIATSTQFEQHTHQENKKKIDNLSPKKLVELPSCKIGGRGLRGSRQEPPGAIHKSGNESKTCAAPRRGLRESKRRFGKQKIADRVADINNLQAGVWREQSLERKAKIQRGVPRSEAPGKNAAHGQV